MDNKKILLVNLSKGKTGELNSKLLGMIFVMKFQAAAMSRADVDESERTDFSLFVDEFQNFSTDSFASILSEARKYRLNLIVANQFTTQLSEEIRGAIFGNVGTILSFRVGNDDAEFLARYFAPVFDVNDLQRLPNWNAIARLMIGGVPSQGFSLAGLPPLGSPNKKLGEALKQLSAAKHGRPKALVEKEIFTRLRTEEKPKPAPVPNRAPQQPKKPTTGSSFLDDWLTKKQTTTPDRPAKSVPQQRPGQQPQAQQPLSPPKKPADSQTESLSESSTLAPMMAVSETSVPQKVPQQSPVEKAPLISRHDVEQAFQSTPVHRDANFDKQHAKESEVFSVPRSTTSQSASGAGEAGDNQKQQSPSAKANIDIDHQKSSQTTHSDEVSHRVSRQSTQGNSDDEGILHLRK